MAGLPVRAAPVWWRLMACTTLPPCWARRVCLAWSKGAVGGVGMRRRHTHVLRKTTDGGVLDGSRAMDGGLANPPRAHAHST